MSTLPILSGREVVQIFVKLGWEIARQRGSHIILVRAGHPATFEDNSALIYINASGREIPVRQGAPRAAFGAKTRSDPPLPLAVSGGADERFVGQRLD